VGVKVRKRLAISREDFLRSLRAACPYLELDPASSTIELRPLKGCPCVHIELLDAPPRRIGALTLPQLDAVFYFPEADREQAETFFTDIRPFFQRGGG